jgi:hypothetical protein
MWALLTDISTGLQQAVTTTMSGIILLTYLISRLPSGYLKWKSHIVGSGYVWSPAVGRDGTMYVGTSVDYLSDGVGYLCAVDSAGNIAACSMAICCNKVCF